MQSQHVKPDLETCIELNRWTRHHNLEPIVPSDTTREHAWKAWYEIAMYNTTDGFYGHDNNFHAQIQYSLSWYHRLRKKNMDQEFLYERIADVFLSQHRQHNFVVNFYEICDFLLLEIVFVFFLDLFHEMWICYWKRQWLYAVLCLLLFLSAYWMY